MKNNKSACSAERYESGIQLVSDKIITILIQMCHVPSWGGGTATEKVRVNK